MSRHSKPIAARVHHIIRAQSFYQSERTAFGVPLAILGGLLIIGSLGSWGYFTGWSPAAMPAALAVATAGVLCFGISALGTAVFDIADCHLRSEARTLTKESNGAE